MADQYLGGLEEAVLLAIQQLGDDAYGAVIHETLAESKRHISIGALYVTLNRLEEKGFVESRMGEATAERGGKAKRYFKLKGAGAAALDESEAIRQRLRLARRPQGGVA
jgi:PadR family transcriptional regulator PadR